MVEIMRPTEQSRIAVTTEPLAEPLGMLMRMLAEILVTGEAEGTRILRVIAHGAFSAPMKMTTVELGCGWGKAFPTAFTLPAGFRANVQAKQAIQFGQFNGHGVSFINLSVVPVKNFYNIPTIGMADQNWVRT